VWRNSPGGCTTNDLTDAKASLSSSSPSKTASAIGRITSIIIQPKAVTSGGIPATIRYEPKSLPGKTIRCLDGGPFEVDCVGAISMTSPSPSSSSTMPTVTTGTGAITSTASSSNSPATISTSATHNCNNDLLIPSNPIILETDDTAAVPSTVRSTAADVLEKARDRFDRFWGGNNNKEDQV